MMTTLSVLREMMRSEPKEQEARPEGLLAFLSLQKLMPVMIGCGILATMAAAVAGGKLLFGEMVSSELRTALFFGLLTPATLIVGGALWMGAPTKRSLAEERRAIAKAKANFYRNKAKADAHSRAAQEAASAHAERIRSLGSSALPKTLARKEQAQHDALDFLIHRRSEIQKHLAARSAGAASVGPYAERDDKAQAARTPFSGGPKDYDKDDAALASMRRVA